MAVIYWNIALIHVFSCLSVVFWVSLGLYFVTIIIIILNIFRG